jgi:16S rRNA (guanine527-N7)-methyltransferase
VNPAARGASASLTLGEGLRALGVPLPDRAADALQRYVDLLARWNRTHNLTAIREPERMVTHHVLDALAVLPHLPAREGLRVLDVGSGGGVPGVPLAIARPRWHVTLLDSNGKKTTFLTQAAIDLGLGNVDVVLARVEAFEPTAPYDVVISRAFGELADFADGAARHLAPGGLLAAMKGVHPDEELAALSPHIELIGAPSIDVPGLDAQRHLILMRSREPA